MEGFEIGIPEIEIPEIEIPDIEMTDMGMTEIEMTEYEIPDIEMSEIEMPENQKRRAAQQKRGHRVVQVKVKDFIRLSVITVTFCNFMLLGTAALTCSLKAIGRKIRRDVAGAKKFACCALTANIFAIIGTIICIIVIALVLAVNRCSYNCSDN
nr:uncharacterized protein si:dkey-204f11.3 [Misgurnus anguillicaudatus]